MVSASPAALGVTSLGYPGGRGLVWAGILAAFGWLLSLLNENRMAKMAPARALPIPPWRRPRWWLGGALGSVAVLATPLLAAVAT